MVRLGDWLAWLGEQGVSVNVGSFIGGGTVREWGKGLALGDATADERAAMTAMLAEAMEDGAFGIATALIYPPRCYAGTEELLELCEVEAAYRGVQITHFRGVPVLRNGMHTGTTPGRWVRGSASRNPRS
jgi:N-acyl-D-amino-acid deacylase